MALDFPNIGTEDGKVTFTTAANWLADSSDIIANEANSFMETLKLLSTEEFAAVGDLPVYNSVVWLGSTAGVLQTPTRPTLTLGNIDTLLSQLNALQPPQAPSTSFEYTEAGYNSQLRQPMIEKLLNDVVNGGYGIDTDDEVALFNRARDREALLGAANVEEIRRAAAATSFPLPQGVLNAALQRARQEEMSKNSSVNRDIALKRADLFVTNRRQVIEQILRSEEQEMALYNAIQNRAILAAQTEVQLAVALFDAAIRLFNTQIAALKSQIEAQLETTRATVQIYAADVAAYASLVNAVVSGAQIDIANSRNVMERDIRVYESKVKQVQFRLQQLRATIDNRRQINQFAVEFFRTGLGAALNGVNGLAVQSGEV